MSQQPPRQLRVLVVEDYADARESLCQLIDMWGHACESASTGASALEVAPAFGPDVVFLDIGMPGMDGYVVACALRKLPSLSGAVFVALSGYGSAEAVERAREAGFFTHLLKPYDPVRLREMLDHFAAVCAMPSDLPRSVC